MRNQTFLRAVLGCVVLLLAGYIHAQGTKAKTVMEIISNRAIWGKDFPLALAQMEALSKSGDQDKTAELTPTTLVRSQRFTNALAADAALKRTTAAFRGAEKKDLFKKTKKNFPFMTRKPVIAVEKAPKVDSVLVALNFGQAEFLKPGVKVTDVQKELGAAERVTYRLIEGRGEELPEILTFYSYANGAITFVESNFSAEPRLLGMVYFDTPKLVTALKSSLK